MKKYVLFDLDGTLTDSAPGVINAVTYALDQLGDNESDRTQLIRFLGPPIDESFTEHFGYSTEQVEQATTHFRTYYCDRGIFENAVFDGVHDLLRTLRGAGRTLVLATSKPMPFVETVLKTYGLAHYFSFVSASEFDGTRGTKDEVIAYAIEKCEITDTSQAVMVGDHRYDVLGAKKHGLTSVGVLHGTCDRVELEAAGADYIVATVGELQALLMSL